MKLKIKKIFSIYLIVQMLLVNFVPVVRAEDGTSTESVTETVTQNTTENVNPTVEPTPETTITQTELTITPTPDPTAGMSEDELEEYLERQALLERRARSAAAAESYLEEGDMDRVVSETSAAMTGVDLTGESKIETGDATSTGVVVNSANNNLIGSAGVSGDPSGASVITSGNGANSDNSGALAIDNNSATVQDNDANVNTVLNQSATTGGNNNSDNTGANSTIKTGDANVTGTVINSVNTNVDGVMVAEFNVADNHTGDLILDFGAGCISGCGTGDIAVSNTGNGTNSDNDASVDLTNTNETIQTNDALINSELNLSADSGNNTASNNTGGNSSIETGDANVEANVLTFANTNVAGDVIYAVVNIFGDLVGDIIMTEEAMNAACGGSCNSGAVSAANTGNGSNSDNDAAITLDNNEAIFQTNDANLGNDLVLDANTGENSASNNTGGTSSIETGDTYVEANVLNIVNTNIVGGTMWLVLINEAGNWVGQLLGAPAGSYMMASEGTEFTIDENGYITATNSGYGSGSVNDASVSQTNNNTTTQTNTADVQNTLNLSANTGGNQANSNTGGSSDIKTGDATIIANLVNFINTNIVGDGKLVVTVVNVFGSWLGDFVGPGQQQQNHDSSGSQQASSESNNSQQSSSNSSNTNNSNSNQFVASIQQSLHINDEDTTDGGTNTVSQGSGSTSVAVAGISTDNSNHMVAAKNKIKINLAWLVLLIPALGLFIVGRKIVYARLLAKKS